MSKSIVRYFVILQDGQRFGPADLALLNQWALEGRVLPDSMLQPEGSAHTILASSVTGLTFAGPKPFAEPGAPNPPTFPDPTASPQPYAGYYRGPAAVGDGGQSDLTLSWVFGALGLAFCLSAGFCGPCTLVGIVFPILGIVFATRAQQKGNPSAQAAKIFSIVGLILQVAGLLFGVALLGLIGLSS